MTSVRRVVTGQKADGKSVFVSDEKVEATTVSVVPGMEFHLMWGADEDAQLSNSHRRFRDRVMWATTTSVPQSRARPRTRVKPAYQTGYVLKSTTCRKDYRRSLM